MDNKRYFLLPKLTRSCPTLGIIYNLQFQKQFSGLNWGKSLIL